MKKQALTHTEEFNVYFKLREFLTYLLMYQIQYEDQHKSTRDRIMELQLDFKSLVYSNSNYLLYVKKNLQSTYKSACESAAKNLKRQSLKYFNDVCPWDIEFLLNSNSMDKYLTQIDAMNKVSPNINLKRQRRPKWESK